MRIGITSDGGHAHYYIRLGLARAFGHCGHQVELHELGSKPLFDWFDEFEPELLLTQTYNVNKAMVKCIEERPHLKVIMKGSDWGKQQETIDLVEYPILVAKQEEIDIIGYLKERTGKPDFVHCHYHPNRIYSTHGSWLDELGIPVVGLMSAADIFDYTGGQRIESFAADVMFVGGYWPYKAKTLDKCILRLCNVNRPYKIKIYGNQGWPVPQYCGSLPNELVKDAMSSATICPSISEPHSQVFGTDIIERPWKILANRCFCISDYVESMVEDVFTNNEVLFAKTPEEFEGHVIQMLNKPDERLGYIERGHKTVINNHTYFNRIAKIFDELKMPWEAKSVLDIYSQIKDNL